LSIERTLPLYSVKSILYSAHNGREEQF